MRIYETGFVLAPSLSEEDTENIIAQMAEIVTQREGRLIKQERWGKRKLAYPIKRFNEGFYVFFQYEGKADIPLEMERRFKQADAVLRYLTLKKEIQAAGRQKKKASGERGAAGAGEVSKEEGSSGEGLAARESLREVK
ncbi:MAG: 30S ribosomal protein S6 [Candidatus Aminicenantes bacterium]|nr:30S ribosomal protein S6 [Candidatus Aminicenantes bacterium]